MKIVTIHTSLLGHLRSTEKESDTTRLVWGGTPVQENETYGLTPEDSRTN